MTPIPVDPPSRLMKAAKIFLFSIPMLCLILLALVAGLTRKTCLVVENVCAKAGARISWLAD